VTDVPKLTVRETVLSTIVAEEVVLLDLDAAMYYRLNASGSRMWELLAEHGDAARVLEIMATEYDVPVDRLRHDLLRLIDDLTAHHLMETDA
jgi:hypothetical protein